VRKSYVVHRAAKYGSLFITVANHPAHPTNTIV